MKIIDFSVAEATRITAICDFIKSQVEVVDPYLIAQRYGIAVSFCDIEASLAYSFFDNLEERFCIYISNKVDSFSANILCFHELGHIFCEGDAVVNLFDTELDPHSEFVANFFAATFLPLDNRFEINDDATIEDFNRHIASHIRNRV